MSEELGRNTEAAVSYSGQLDTILREPLTPANIGFYGEQALSQVIELVEDVVFDYNSQNPTLLQGAEAEEAAFAHFGLMDIGVVLDHLADVVESIHEIHNLSEHMVPNKQVILPPDSAPRSEIVPGTGSFAPKLIVPRLATTLFLLRHEFGVDIGDLTRVAITQGIVREDMMRNTSYVALQIPELHRTILVSAKEANATFVFDQAALTEAGIRTQELVRYTKNELRQLMHTIPWGGQRIIYSSDFVISMSDALSNPLSAAPKTLAGNYEHSSESFLYPTAPADCYTQTKLAELWGIGGPTIRVIINELKSQLGPTAIYRTKGGNTAAHYDHQQLTMIWQEIENRGLVVDKAPKDWLSMSGMARTIGVEASTVATAITQLGEQLGEVKRCRFGPQRVDGYSPEQQELILNVITETLRHAQAAPDGFANVNNIVKNTGVNAGAINHAIDALTDQLGEVKTYRFSTSITTGFSPTQQQLIYDYLTNREMFVPEAPDNYLSRTGISRFYGVHERTIGRTIEALGEQLGAVAMYRFHARRAPGYSPEQQVLIRSQLDQQGSLEPPAPADVLSRNAMAKAWNVHIHSVNNAILLLQSELGEIKTYMFGHPADGYSPSQQTIIRQYLETH